MREVRPSGAAKALAFARRRLARTARLTGDDPGRFAMRVVARRRSLGSIPRLLPVDAVRDLGGHQSARQSREVDEQMALPPGMSKFAANWLFGDGPAEGVPFDGGAALPTQPVPARPSFLPPPRQAGTPVARGAKGEAVPRGRIQEGRPVRLSATPPPAIEAPTLGSPSAPPQEPPSEAAPPTADSAELPQGDVTLDAAPRQSQSWSQVSSAVASEAPPVVARVRASESASSARPTPVPLRMVARTAAPEPPVEHARRPGSRSSLLARVLDRVGLGNRSNRADDQRGATSPVGTSPAERGSTQPARLRMWLSGSPPSDTLDGSEPAPSRSERVAHGPAVQPMDPTGPTEPRAPRVQSTGDEGGSADLGGAGSTDLGPEALAGRGAWPPSGDAIIPDASSIGTAGGLPAGTMDVGRLARSASDAAGPSPDVASPTIHQKRVPVAPSVRTSSPPSRPRPLAREAVPETRQRPVVPILRSAEEQAPAPPSPAAAAQPNASHSLRDRLRARALWPTPGDQPAGEHAWEGNGSETSANLPQQVTPTEGHAPSDQPRAPFLPPERPRLRLLRTSAAASRIAGSDQPATSPGSGERLAASTGAALQRDAGAMSESVDFAAALGLAQADAVSDSVSSGTEMRAPRAVDGAVPAEASSPTHPLHAPPYAAAPDIERVYEQMLGRLRRDLMAERERMGDLLGDLP